MYKCLNTESVFKSLVSDIKRVSLRLTAEMEATHDFDPRLKTPFTSLIVGPTMSGKTVFVKKLLENSQSLISPAPNRIVWCYGEYQPLHSELKVTVPDIELVEGFPEKLEDTFTQDKCNLLVLDDLMNETGNDDRLGRVFTRMAHHRNLSVILIQQNLFPKFKESRTASLNTQYMVLFKNPRDRSQIVSLASQMYPKRTKFFSEVFEDATKTPHGYLLIDLKQETPDELRLRTGILPHETTYVYAPK